MTTQNKFIPPSGYTAGEVVNIIDKIVNMLAPGFTFGYFDIDEVKQHGRLKAIEVLADGKYDPHRKLDNFLYSHIKKRYINLKRDLFKRTDPPCHLCHDNIYTSGFRHSAHADGQVCERYASWQKRNMSKQNIMNALNIANISDENEMKTKSYPDVENNFCMSEIVNEIDRAMPLELRQIYLQMKDGYSVPKAKKEQVNTFILRYAQENNLL